MKLKLSKAFTVAHFFELLFINISLVFDFTKLDMVPAWAHWLFFAGVIYTGLAMACTLLAGAGMNKEEADDRVSFLLAVGCLPIFGIFALVLFLSWLKEKGATQPSKEAVTA